MVNIVCMLCLVTNDRLKGHSGHATALHYITLHYITLLYTHPRAPTAPVTPAASPHYTTLLYSTVHYTTLHSPEGTDSTGDASSFASEARNPARFPLAGREGGGGWRGPRKLWLVTLWREGSGGGGGKRREGERGEGGVR